MMKGKVERLSKENFRMEVQKIIDSETYFYLLQNPHFITLDREKITLNEIENYPSGRLFNKSGELRWKGGIYLKFYEDEKEQSGEWDVSDKTNIYLWEDESKIPYRWPDKTKPKSVTVREYKKNNMIEHYRFLEINFPGGKKL